MAGLNSNHWPAASGVGENAAVEADLERIGGAAPRHPAIPLAGAERIRLGPERPFDHVMEREQ
jgi:hypothetical protein